MPLKHYPKILIRTAGKTHFICCSDIRYCIADGSYSKIFFINEQETLLVSKRLGDLFEMIKAPYIVRISQSVLVNSRLTKCLHHKTRKIELDEGLMLSFTCTVLEMENMMLITYNSLGA